MNEMYSMGLSIHSYGSAVLLGLILLNVLFLKNTKSIQGYKKAMALYMAPLSITIFGGVIFSGTIMMAAKQLHFTLENIAMIIISVVLIALEIKRIKTLKYIDQKKENALLLYALFANKILTIEAVLVLAISIWMWSI